MFFARTASGAASITGRACGDIQNLAYTADAGLVGVGQDAELRALQLMWVDVLLELSAGSCQPDVRVAAQATLSAVSSFLTCVKDALLFFPGSVGGQKPERGVQDMSAQQVFNRAATIRCGRSQERHNSVW